MWDTLILPKSVSGLAGELLSLWWISCANKVNDECSSGSSAKCEFLESHALGWWIRPPTDIEGNITVDLVYI